MWNCRSLTRRERISTQPISMMRSPSLALRPVVSVSSTTWRVIVIGIPVQSWYSLIGQRVGAFIFRMPGMAAHPVPLYLMFGGELVELLPQVDILHRLLVGGAPAAALPVVDPARDALLDVERVRIEADPARPLQRFQGANDRQELHAVVGRRRLATVELLLLAFVAQHGAPAAGARIPAAGAIAVDLDDIIRHGDSYGCAAIPARAPGAARAPCARPA